MHPPCSSSEDSGDHGAFVLQTHPTGSDPSTATPMVCRVLVIASGLSKPHVPATVQGIENVMGYEELPANGKPFQGQAVMVLGMGNAAMETADALAPYTNYVHVIPGRLNEHMSGPDKHNVLSWESRYVGNVRAINAGLFDAYLLKSLDGAATAPDATGSAFLKCGTDGKKTCLFIKHQDAANQRKRPKFHSPKGVDPLDPATPMLHTGVYSLDDPWAVRVADELLEAGVAAYSKTEAKHSRMSIRVSGAEVNQASGKSQPSQTTTLTLRQFCAHCLFLKESGTPRGAAHVSPCFFNIAEKWVCPALNVGLLTCMRSMHIHTHMRRRGVSGREQGESACRRRAVVQDEVPERPHIRNDKEPDVGQHDGRVCTARRNPAPADV